MKRAKEPVPSPVVQLLDSVYREANGATSHSWERLNHAMRSALSLAIGGGFKFEPDDFKYVFSHYRSGYWIGESSEWCYASAIAEGNISAWQSFEVYKSRRPFIVNDVDVANRHDSHFAHSVGSRQIERLHVGAAFKWKGEKVTVTSFADDSSYLVACSYVKGEREDCKLCHRATTWSQDKLKKRFKITHDDIIADRAERKQRKAIEKELADLTTANVLTAKEILDRLGVKTKADFDAVPLKKLTNVLAWAKAKDQRAAG